MHLCAFANAGDVLHMLQPNDQCGDEQDQSSPNVLTHDAVTDGDEDGGAHGNNANVINNEYQHQLRSQGDEEEPPVKAEKHAAEAGQTLAALEFHVEGENVPQNAGDRGDGKDQLQPGEDLLHDENHQKGLGDINQRAKNTTQLAKQNQGIGGTGISGAFFFNINSSDLSEEKGGIDGADEVSYQPATQIF